MLLASLLSILYTHYNDTDHCSRLYDLEVWMFQLSSLQFVPNTAHAQGSTGG